MIADLFAGPGGWDCAARWLDLDPIGFELDRDTCATRAAAGLRTIRTQLGPDGYQLPTGTVLAGLIASPPCQAFSAAGGREGANQLPEFIAALEADDWRWLPSGWHPDLYLLAETARWAFDHQPRWIAMEQVPAVLPFWQALGRKLEQFGYRWWAGVLNAADYGVPQCRRRAILMAHAARAVHPPSATHAEYPQADLFGGCPEPWRTMADGIGIDPGVVVDLRQNTLVGGGQYVSYHRSADRPSATITGRSAYGQWVLNPGATPSQPNRRRYALTEPAPTIAFGKDLASWCWERPATTIAGDLRCWPPGHKINGDDIARLGEDEARARYGDRAGTDAPRLTVEQAAALQSFPPGWPWQGNKGSQARQVGNAVPPLLAEAILRELVA